MRLTRKPSITLFVVMFLLSLATVALSASETPAPAQGSSAAQGMGNMNMGSGTATGAKGPGMGAGMGMSGMTMGPGMGMGGMGGMNMGSGMGMGGMMNGMAMVPADKQTAVTQIQEEYRSRLFALRQDLRAKEAELEALMLQAQPDINKAKAVSKEIAGIQGQMLDQGIEMHARITKETGIRMPMGMGGGMGMGGMGGGMGGGGCMMGGS